MSSPCQRSLSSSSICRGKVVALCVAVIPPSCWNIVVGVIVFGCGGKVHGTGAPYRIFMCRVCLWSWCGNLV